MTAINNEIKKKGVSVRKLNYMMAVVTLVVSVLLLLATFEARNSYYQMRENTAKYIQWQRDAYDLQRGSDYLTEQVRCFVETGERAYLDNYFEEAEVSQRRDKALDSVREIMGDSDGYRALAQAMEQSKALMDREYYAMRLTVAAYGYDVAEFPEAIQSVALSAEDAARSPARQEALARSKVFDDVYRARKEAISANTDACMTALAEEIDNRQAETADRLDHLLSQERVLIIVSIIAATATVLLTMLLVVSPLLRAVMYIRADEPIPIRGSDEFRFLAKTYNLMYEANREKREQLAFDATHDNLTGSYNRTGYDFFLKNTDWATSALVLFDVDRFKQINDTYGHEAGDRVLARVAELLRSSFRSQDYVCRIGGDEFAVIMVHANNAPLELVPRKVEMINLALGVAEEGRPEAHVSCGVAYGDQETDVEETFRQADAALYRVKRAGGRGCEVSRD